MIYAATREEVERHRKAFIRKWRLKHRAVADSLQEAGDRLFTFSEHLDDDGETIFAQACKMGLEGIVSKRRDFPYRSARCKSWVKIKNPGSPAVLRIQDGTWQAQ
jgi:ATP-dependent DNA ligase